MTRVHAPLALGFTLATALAASAASAQGVPAGFLPSPAAISEARDRFNRGVALSQEHSYNAAMVEFQRAFELTRNPAVLFNISATHELTGHYVEALDAMLDFERLAPADTVSSRRAEVTAALGRLRGRVGTIMIRFDAAGLSVRIDNLERAVTEARTGLRVPAGRHRISLSAPHFSPREEEVDIAGGSTVVLSEPLVPERAFMAVECNVTGAEVLVDGHPVATTPTTSPLPVPEGVHHVMIRRPGFNVYETDVNTVGAGARVRAQLAWSDPMPRDVAAHVVIQASEPDTVAYLGDRRISLDGADLVPPGRHPLRVEHRDFLTDERDVDLAAGRDNTISVFLQPTPAFRESFMASRRRSLVTGAVVTGAGALVMGAGLAGFFIFNGQYGTNDARYATLATRTARGGSVSDAELAAQNCPTGNSGNFRALENCRDNAAVDRDNSNVLRWVSVGVGGAGLITAIVGVIVLAGAPSGSRFERRTTTTWRDNVRLLGGLQRVGVELSF